MPSSVSERHRARLARALAEFWAGGAGPTHGEVTDVLGMFGLDVTIGSKRDRVSEAVKVVDRQDLVPLLEELLELLRHRGVFDRSSFQTADEADVKRLADALAPFEVTLLPDGNIAKDPGSLVDAPTLPDEAAVREHVRRMHLALGEGDSALLLGSSKELLESTERRGDVPVASILEVPPRHISRTQCQLKSEELIILESLGSGAVAAATHLADRIAKSERRLDGFDCVRVA